jgi:hypothetical protein
MRSPSTEYSFDYILVCDKVFRCSANKRPPFSRAVSTNEIDLAEISLADEVCGEVREESARTVDDGR